MLPSLLTKIKNWTAEKGYLADDKLDIFLKLLEKYKAGDWLYPGVMIRNLEISKSEAYTLLDYLKDKGILQVNYEIYCHACNQFEGEIYETFSQIPDELYCERCDGELNPVDNAIVLYKVLQVEI